MEAFEDSIFLLEEWNVTKPKIVLRDSSLKNFLREIALKEETVRWNRKTIFETGCAQPTLEKGTSFYLVAIGLFLKF